MILVELSVLAMFLAYDIYIDFHFHKNQPISANRDLFEWFRKNPSFCIQNWWTEGPKTGCPNLIRFLSCIVSRSNVAVAPKYFFCVYLCVLKSFVYTRFGVIEIVSNFLNEYNWVHNSGSSEHSEIVLLYSSYSSTRYIILLFKAVMFLSCRYAIWFCLSYNFRSVHCTAVLLFSCTAILLTKPNGASALQK